MGWKTEESSSRGEKCYHMGCGIHQHPTQYVTTAIKQPGRQADHSPPYRAQIRNKLSNTSTLPYAFDACRGTNFSFVYLSRLANVIYLSSLVGNRAKVEWVNLSRYSFFLSSFSYMQEIRPDYTSLIIIHFYQDGGTLF
jgi:hypothetical protein